MTPDEVHDYTRTMARIDGWFWPAAAYLFAWIDDQQRRAGVAGNLFEIGVYHGKSAIMLARLLQSGERLGVCDLFGRKVDSMLRPPRVAQLGSRIGQQLRSIGDGTMLIDAEADTGDGFLRQFIINMRLNVPTSQLVDVYLGASGRLDVAETTDRCRLFHIDGGHESADVVADLAVADRALAPGGVVILDDFHNFAWPGVAEGFFTFMRDRPDQFAPLVIGFNKGVLCRPADHAAWRARLADESGVWAFVPRGPFSLKTVTLCGWETTVFYTPSYRSPDARRSVLTTLYQMRPRLADWIARQLQYHGAL